MGTLLGNMIMGHHYLGAEIYSSGSGDKAAYLQVDKKNKELVIANKEIFDLTEFEQREKSAFPLALCITNNQVLQKEVDSIENNDKKLLHKAFPNVNLEEFYYEIIRLKTKSIVSICRRSYIDNLLISLQKKFKIISINLGISPIKQLMSFSLPEEISTNSKTIFVVSEEMQNNNITEIKYHHINGLNIPNTQLLPFCQILQTVFNTHHSTGTIIELNERLNSDFRQGSFFSATIKYGLIAILLVLLANFFAFSHYFGKANSLRETVSLNKAGIDNIARLKNRINEKQKKLSDYNAETHSRSSYILNEIVKGIPSSLLLTSIDYQPLQKKIKEEEIIMLSEKLILVSGHTVSGEAFTAWIEAIGKFEWIEKVIIVSFGKDQENKTAFEIKIELK